MIFFIASSSTDLRLGATLVMRDPAHPERDFNPASRLPVKLPVTLKKGEELTIPLSKPDFAFKRFDLTWRMDSDCIYEILLNQGGGQFAPFGRRHAKGGAERPSLKDWQRASDLRIRIVSGSGTITDFDCEAL